MRFRMPGPLAVGCLAWLLVAFGLVYPDAPPPAHTGGFGEPTCQECHFDAPLNDAAGMFRVEGLPERYKPGAVYDVSVRLAQPGMERWGFQMAARFDAGNHKGTQAGAFDATTEDVTIDEQDGVEYIRQTASETAPDSIVWFFRWRAPDAASGSVAFHLSANAANGDESAFGDFVYTWEGRAAAR